MAWLNSVPRERHSGHAADERTRGQRMRADDGLQRAPLPPIEAGAYLHGYLFDAGPTGHGAAGPVPLGYADIEAWARLTATPLAPWEAQTLRELSRAYVAELRAGEDPASAPPWVMPEPQDRGAIGARVADALRARAQPRARRC